MVGQDLASISLVKRACYHLVTTWHRHRRLQHTAHDVSASSPADVLCRHGRPLLLLACAALADLNRSNGDGGGRCENARRARRALLRAVRARWWAAARPTRHIPASTRARTVASAMHTPCRRGRHHSRRTGSTAPRNADVRRGAGSVSRFARCQRRSELAQAFAHRGHRLAALGQLGVPWCWWHSRHSWGRPAEQSRSRAKRGGTGSRARAPRGGGALVHAQR